MSARGADTGVTPQQDAASQSSAEPDRRSTEPRVTLCGAKTRQGHPCRQVAGYMTDHVGTGRCGFHGGASPNGRTFAARQTASLEAARLGIAIETDPHEALEACVAIVAGQVAWLQSQVSDLDEGKAVERTGLHPVLRALEASIDRYARVAKAAADAGVEERKVQLDELLVRQVAGAIRSALAEVQLSPEQEQRVREAVARHLQSLEGQQPASLNGTSS